MHRRSLLNMLAGYRQARPDEQQVVDRICELVHGHADCFDRRCRPGHITGAAWIFSADRRRCLLAHHRQLDRWLQLGGHADGQWEIELVALREAREESGLRELRLVPIDGMLQPLDVDVHSIPARYSPGGELLEEAHEHHDVRFLFIAEGDEPIRCSDESHEVAWFTPAEIEARTDDPSVLRMLKKALELIG